MGTKKQIESGRLQFAKNAICKLGIKITFECKTRIEFYHAGHKVMFFPYTGWHSGKSIKDGRGIKNLLRQIA